MTDNIIIELKQNDGTTVNDGEYLNNLSKPVTIYEGDEIAVNRVFIDTEAETDALIDIPFDIEIQTNQILGITNDNLAKFNAFSDGSNQIDMIDYFIYDSIPAGTATEANMIHITKLASFAADETKNSGKVGDPDGTNPIEFEYTDYVGQQRRIYVSLQPPQIPQQDLGAEFNINVFAQAQPNLNTRAFNTFQIVQTTENLKRCANCNLPTTIFGRTNEPPIDNKTVSFFCTQPGDGTFNRNNLTPHAFNFRTVIEQGKYLAQDLATITSLLTVYNHFTTLRNWRRVGQYRETQNRKCTTERPLLRPVIQTR